MFYLTYIVAELRRRSGRTILTALGLGIGVALVVTVNSLSAGLDRAQAEVLEPLTGVGTDMTVSRPIDFSPPAGGGFPDLSDEERKRLQEENGGGRFGLRDLGEPGSRFSRDTFVSTAQLSFPGSEVGKIRGLDGVSAAAGGLTLNSIHIEGVVPEETQEPGRFEAPVGPGERAGPPENIDASNLIVSGVDPRSRELGAITPALVTSGRYLGTRTRAEAVLNESYASREGLELGDKVTLGGKKFNVVGIAETPLGGQSADVYVKLAQLQTLSDRTGRVNTVYVRAESSDDVAGVASAIERSLDGASVTTADDLAERVSGTLVDAKNLAGKLGTALALVGLLLGIPHREPPHAGLGDEASPRARHAEGTWLVAAAGGAPGHRGSARPGPAGRGDRRGARRSRAAAIGALAPDARGDRRRRGGRGCRGSSAPSGRAR